MLLSNKLHRIYFNEPIIEEIKPPARARPANPSYAEVTSLLKMLRTQGWDERAMVTRRIVFPTSEAPNWYEMGRPINWGIVMDLRSSVILTDNQPYAPIKVRWVKDGTLTEHWPEDLVLIHEALSMYETERVLKELY